MAGVGVNRLAPQPADGLGSIRALTEQFGAASDRYDFEAFGTLLDHRGSDPNANLFAGEVRDSYSNLYFNRARWLDPNVGRFVSSDPFKGRAATPVTLHRFLYAGLDPVLRSDPTGLDFSAGFSVAIATIPSSALFWIQRLLSREVSEEDRNALIGQAVLRAWLAVAFGGPCAEYFCGSKPGRESAAENAIVELWGKLEAGKTDNPNVGIQMSAPYIQRRHYDGTSNLLLYRVPGKAVINEGGPFFARTNLKMGSRRNGRVGSYEPNTSPARTLMILHELAHLVWNPDSDGGPNWLIPDDGSDDNQSNENSRTVQRACRSQIQ